jgi:hypothetical protein
LYRYVLESSNDKYRRLKMANAKIAGAVGGGTFGKELLVALGFVAKNDAKDGLVFVLGPGGADVSLAVPAIQLAIAKLEERGGGGGVGGGGGGGASMLRGGAVDTSVGVVGAVTDATNNMNITTAAAAPAAGSASAPAPAASAAAASGADIAKEALQKAVHAEFTRLVNEEGVAANEAAAAAINNVRAKMAAKATAANVAQ